MLTFVCWFEDDIRGSIASEAEDDKSGSNFFPCLLELPFPFQDC